MVRNLKEKSNAVIILYYEIKKYYRYLSPELQRIFRKFSARGADLVIAQHTHCVGCYEIRNGIHLYMDKVYVM